ncbi:hypothetical protein [Streptomyces sp. NBC_01429]|uniref:hypothetical protein n=1 Tax=Streptomyces sp. NBC_01429 TaxID=2903862 RepID=UPI002E2CFF66|nr:hypothetical protein [Streptomyces sp. NBC_01429]
MSEQKTSPSSSPDSSPEEPAASPEGSPDVPSPAEADADAGPRPPEPPRRVLRAVTRWAVVLAVFAGLGSGVAYGISGMERDDVPGLGTVSDGRWDYPELSLPALPAGSPRPFNDDNPASIHYADPRDLLLPAPAGATADKELSGGWVSTERFTAEYEKERRTGLRTALREASVRNIAARGWTMPDGTEARIYLLHFQGNAHTFDFFYEQIDPANDAGVPLTAARETELDEDWPEAAADAVQGTDAYVFQEPEPYGATQVRQAYVVAGDTLALIVHEKKGGTPAVPFHQTVILQNQLLG